MASSHAAAMATAAMAAAATATAARECRRRQGKRRSERTRDETTKKLVVHPNSSVVDCSDGRRRKKEQPAEPMDPMISTDKCDSF
jgi:hypothetical protein